jgi:penicillin-binding protein 2
MLIFDELKENDPRLRWLAFGVAGGLCLLLAGLWWVQIVSARKYENHLVTQSYRTVRIPAVRGKILDRYGRVLAEDRPCYELSLHLDTLHDQFQTEYARLRPGKTVTNAPPFWTLGFGQPSVSTQRVRLKQSQIEALTWQARCDAANAVVARIGQELGQPLMLDRIRFERDYERQRALPFTILSDLNGAQIARFEEQYSGNLGVDLEVQSERVYPLGTVAGHVLGYLIRDDQSENGEDASFSYRLPDYRGLVGIEGGFDKELRGRAGTADVLVDNYGYRQSETILTPPEPGRNVVLTLDASLEAAVERAIQRRQGADARAAVVVMDVRNGDVLAMVSSPAINPVYASNNPIYLNDTKLKPQINRATYGNYAPGSIFKPIVGLACLKAGLDPDAIIDNPGYIYIGRRRIHDLAPPGEYDFKKAIAHSSNTYFITNGVRVGPEKIVEMGEKFHLGERTGLPTRQETAGIFPTLAEVRSASWHVGDTANLSIGQGDIAVTPIQMAVVVSAIANGGTVLWPRLVERIEPQDPATGGATTVFPAGVVRDRLDVPQRDLQILREAMLDETENGTGRAAQVPGLRICGKTGTAQVMNQRGQETSDTTWFVSFAPYENPRYAVVVMVEGGVFGSVNCTPIAHDIYEHILQEAGAGAQKSLAQAQ